MRIIYEIAQVVVLSLQWGFYGFWMLAIIINPETWFFGAKFSGMTSLTIHFTIGVSGMLLGWLVYKSNKPAYVGGVVLFLIVLSSLLINHFRCWEFDLYC